MPPIIRVLDDILADQIAAGEVVERPASVVKELLENAVDAGATHVHVTVDDGGQSLVRVADDGCGMVREDALRCVQRHATSKVRDQADLFAIQTLGFRGEALPSIASVSRFTLTTRPKDASEGTHVGLLGGEPQGSRPVGCAPGTVVEVRDLFYNVPARRKFLKAKATESGHIAGVCVRMALAYPALHLTLTRDGRLAREFLPGASFPQRVAELFPGESLTTLELALDDMQVTTVLGAPERARNGATGLHLVVNGRPVKDVALARAIAFAYGSVIPPGRFPLGAVELRLPPSELDVNVHPQKSEVRFRDGRNRFTALTRALAKRLGTSAFRGPAARPKDFWNERLAPGPRTTQAEESDSPLLPTHETPHNQADLFRSGPPQVPFGVREPSVRYASSSDVHPLETSPPAAAKATESARPDPYGFDIATIPRPTRTTGTQVPVEQAAAQPAQDESPAVVGTPSTAPPTRAPGSEAGFFSSLRFLGQVRRMLLVCEGRDGLYVIDQHAADERVRYNRLRNQYASNQVKTQRLLFPERVECNEAEVAVLQENHELCTRMGLECSALGDTTIAVHAVPALLHRAPPAQLLRDLLAETQGKADRAFGDAVDMALATMACHAAVRAGDSLTDEEARALLRALDEVEDFGGHCPHGRPVAFDIRFSDLERRLGR